MIKVKNLNKYFNKNKSNEIHVINNTSFELPSKGLISFLGHSGSGKTTLLNVLGGLDKAKGSIEYDDLEFNKYNMGKIDQYRSKHIGYVFQNYNLLLEETVYDNLRIALELINVTDLDEINKRIEYTLKAVGMYKYRKKKAFALSGGQQQRVSIARALVKNCKIIIADEPTGNLDSNNTIEVMNILKKISKDALVLLVTHERNIADFYSDYIFELKDGQIISQTEMSGDKTLQRDTNNIAYLKDMYLNEANTSLGNFKLYTENDEPINLDLSFIVKNGTIYLKTDSPIKLLSNSNLKVVDDHYQEMEASHVDDFTYDTSWYRDLRSNKNVFKRFLLAIRNSFLSFKNVKKRVKFIYAGLVCIGAVCAIAMIALINSSVIDESSLNYNRNYSSIITTDYETTPHTVINEAYKESAIDNIISPIYMNVTFEKQIIVHIGITSYSNGILIPYQEDRVELVLGNKPINDNEIVISDNIASKIVKDSKDKISKELLIGETIKLRGIEYKICGISTNDNNMIYSTLNKYCDLIFFSGNNGYYYDENDYYDEVVSDKYWYQDTRFLSYRKAENETGLYEVIEGVDVSTDKSKYEVLVPMKEYMPGGKINIEGYDYTIVGACEYKFGGDVYIVNQDVSIIESYGNVFVDNIDSKYKLVEGNPVSNDDEILVSIYSKYIIGEIVNGRRVVGRFTGGSEIINKVITTYNVAITSQYFYDYIFDVKSDAINDVCDKYLYELYDCYTAQYLNAKYSNQELIAIFQVLFIVLAVVCAIFIYFIMRSKMIADIYTIGVYRSLGASRMRINRKYIIDSVILTTFTVLVGYIIVVVGYTMISSLINGLFGDMEILKGSILYTVLGGIAVYLVMIFFGMLPIILLMRKTPSEICSKYDI